MYNVMKYVMYFVLTYGNTIYTSYIIYIFVWQCWIQLMRSVIKVENLNQLMNAGTKTFFLVYGTGEKELEMDIVVISYESLVAYCDLLQNKYMVVAYSQITTK